MTVSPTPEMFYGGGPEMSEEEALSELTKDLTDIGVDEQEILQVISMLSTDQNGVYSGRVGQTAFTARRMLNNRFLVKRHLGAEEK